MTVRVFVSGQSNALGRGTGGPAFSLVDSRVGVWNNVNPLGANGTAFVSAETALAGGTFDNTDRNNLGVWFCDRLTRHLNDDVDMTIVARGATSISAWKPGGDPPMLQECIDVWTATGQGPANIFLWHQGEGAVAGDYATYRSDFAVVVSELAAGGVIDADTIIILGGTAEENEDRINFNREALLQIAIDDPRSFYAVSNGLPTFDGTHFTGQATYSFGAERYFNAFIQAETNHMDIWALVNEGGEPGTPGSGENKVANLAPLLQEGYRLKSGPIIMTTDQTYTPSDGTIAILVEAQGAGGGGGGVGSSGSIARAGAGGGGGGYCARFIENPEASYDVEVGAGGAGGVGVAGSNGSKATLFGLVLTANAGGGGGTSGTSATQAYAVGGSGGFAEGGDIDILGQQGDNAIKLSATVRLSGRGAHSRFGRGGNFKGSTSDTGQLNGDPAFGYGAGGGGGVSSTTVDGTGGDGAPGVVIVWEFLKG